MEETQRAGSAPSRGTPPSQTPAVHRPAALQGLFFCGFMEALLQRHD